MFPTFNRSELLSIFTHAPADEIKVFAESVLEHLADVTVLRSRTGLVMVPYTDTAQGTVFHLGEVLVSEAHVRLSDGTEGYGMVAGRDIEFAMAAAVLDAAFATGIMQNEIAAFARQQADAQAAADAELLHKVEATRVEMETF